MRSLRSRFILSHILPTLVVIPLMGILLVYLLETQILLSNLSTEVSGQAQLVAELATEYNSVWVDPIQAQIFVDHFALIVTARIMLLDNQGHLLASSDPQDTIRIGQALDLPGLPTVQAGKIDERRTYSRSLNTNVVDVLVPVSREPGRVEGVVRLTHRLSTVVDRFQRLRYLTTGVLLAGLILGGVLGWGLALDLERPLERVTGAVSQIAKGEPLPPLPEEGPTEIRNLSRAVNSLVERLGILEQARRQLLANLVHEIGRPLGALRSAVEALQGGAIDETTLRQELLMGMRDEINRLERLLEDLSHLYTQFMGPLELARKPVALGDWLHTVLATWSTAAHKKHLTWETSIPNELPTLFIDPDRLAQALGNLVSNAIKYTPSGGTVLIGAGVGEINPTNEPEGARKPFLWIQVADTGPGIAISEQELIFTPFYRGSRSRFPQGMGLGLTIARDLVSAHGGRLSLDSQTGKGSKFTIWLPLDRSLPAL